MDIHATAQLGYMVSTVGKLIIAIIVLVGATENAVILEADLRAFVILVGLVPTVHPSIICWHLPE